MAFGADPFAKEDWCDIEAPSVKNVGNTPVTPTQGTKGHDDPVMAMACHASGGLLTTVGADRKVLVWDVGGGFCTHYFKGHKDVVTSIMFHPDTNKTLVWSLDGISDDADQPINLKAKAVVVAHDKDIILWLLHQMIL